MLFIVVINKWLLVISKSNNRPWLLLAIYASTYYKHWRVLWNETSNLIQDILILAVGNFNCIDIPQEKRGGKPYFDMIEIREFWELLQLNGLLDFGFIGPIFVWCNNC